MASTAADRGARGKEPVPLATRSSFMLPKPHADRDYRSTVPSAEHAQ